MKTYRSSLSLFFLNHTIILKSRPTGRHWCGPIIGILLHVHLIKSISIRSSTTNAKPTSVTPPSRNPYLTVSPFSITFTLTLSPNRHHLSFPQLFSTLPSPYPVVQPPTNNQSTTATIEPNCNPSTSTCYPSPNQQQNNPTPHPLPATSYSRPRILLNWSPQ